MDWKSKKADISPRLPRARAFRGYPLPLVASFRVDWFRVMTDITRTKLSIEKIAKELDVAKATAWGWKEGVEPRHYDGERLITLWCEITGSDRDRLPMLISKQFWLSGALQRHPNSDKLRR